MKTLGKLIVSLAALTFLAAGLEFWFVPEQAAQHFGLEATSGFGLVSMRAEFGGLFIGLALLCGAGAWTKRRAGLIAASVVLAAIVVGRTVGWVVTGGADIGAIELAIELAALAGLTLLARSLGGTPEASQAHDPHQPLKIALASLGVLALVSGVALLTPSVQQECSTGRRSS
jgi:hypothetical protein